MGILLAGSVWNGKGASARDLEKNHNDTPACGWMDPYTRFILFYESLWRSLRASISGRFCGGSFVPFAFSLLSSTLQIGRSKASSKRATTVTALLHVTCQILPNSANLRLARLKLAPWRLTLHICLHRSWRPLFLLLSLVSS